MKIGIITFHWATNYGAVLQTYALQTYLEKRGHDVQIINYRPKEYLVTFTKLLFTPRIFYFWSNFKSYLKEKQLEKFRKKFLKQTSLYVSFDELKKCPPELDVYITGSDQVWNPFFTLKGERGVPTPVYFLPFGSSEILRVAYAVSFGCTAYPRDASEIAKEYISSINHISVRENSGITIVEHLGGRAFKLPDPTLLLQRDCYSFRSSGTSSSSIFIYMLHDEVAKANCFITQLESRDYRIKLADSNVFDLSIEKWLEDIACSRFVITNSYHGMIFSLLNRVPFVVILSEGTKSGMNDRFVSLLSYLGLEDRLLLHLKDINIENFITGEIDWDNIDTLLNRYRERTDKFFEAIL